MVARVVLEPSGLVTLQVIALLPEWVAAKVVGAWCTARVLREGTATLEGEGDGVGKAGDLQVMAGGTGPPVGVILLPQWRPPSPRLPCSSDKFASCGVDGGQGRCWSRRDSGDAPGDRARCLNRVAAKLWVAFTARVSGRAPPPSEVRVMVLARRVISRSWLAVALSVGVIRCHGGGDLDSAHPNGGEGTGSGVDGGQGGAGAARDW